eukprot:jgi/Picsp_1/3852/NSC_01364-R1_protein
MTTMRGQGVTLQHNNNSKAGVSVGQGSRTRNHHYMLRECELSTGRFLSSNMNNSRKRAMVRKSADDVQMVMDYSDEEEEGEYVQEDQLKVRDVDVAGDEEAKAFAIDMARVAWETKGEDILLLDVSPVVYWTRYMVFITVFSRPQLNAILSKIDDMAFEKYGRRASCPVTAKSSWELLDFGDVVVHVLTAEEREYYDLESFYAAADEVELPFSDDSGGSGGMDWKRKLVE